MSLRIRRRGHLAVVVVIAEDREHAVRRLQRRQKLRHWFDEVAIDHR